jgi:hypothetical protein
MAAPVAPPPAPGPPDTVGAVPYVTRNPARCTLGMRPRRNQHVTAVATPATVTREAADSDPANTAVSVTDFSSVCCGDAVVVPVDVAVALADAVADAELVGAELRVADDVGTGCDLVAVADGDIVRVADGVAMDVAEEEMVLVAVREARAVTDADALMVAGALLLALELAVAVADAVALGVGAVW